MFWGKACDGLCGLLDLLLLVETPSRVSIVRVCLCQTHCKQVPDFSRATGSDKLAHVAFLQFLPLGQYGLCYGYCFSGPLPLRSSK